MKKLTTIELQSKSKPNVWFEINIESHFGVYNEYQKFTLLPVSKKVEVKEREGKKCILISSFNFDSSVQNYIKSSFGVQTKKGDIYLQITDESWNHIQALISDFKTEVRNFKTNLEARASEMPVKYYMYDFLDWGDYSINYEREIQVWRKALPEENGEKVMKISYKLWNNNIEGHSEEWGTDFSNAGGNEGETKVQISKEIADKWIAVWKEVQAEKARKEAEEKAKREAAKCAEEKRIEKLYANVESVNKTEIRRTPGSDGDDLEQTITVKMKSGKVFKFMARNIFDFGFVLNPTYIKGGGMLMNIESFIENNGTVFNNSEKISKYREKNPTETGYVWNRSDEPSIPVEKEELEAAMVAQEETQGLTGIRM